MMVRTNIGIEVSGPLFGRRARADVRRMLDDMKVEVAQSGVQMAQREFGTRIQEHNTGYGVAGGYVSQIRHEEVGEYGDQIITDGGVIYGPWLDYGAYSPPKRFRGYRVWRRVRQKLRRWWVPVAERRVAQLAARWNR